MTRFNWDRAERQERLLRWYRQLPAGSIDPPPAPGSPGWPQWAKTSIRTTIKRAQLKQTEDNYVADWIAQVLQQIDDGDIAAASASIDTVFQRAITATEGKPVDGTEQTVLTIIELMRDLVESGSN